MRFILLHGLAGDTGNWDIVSKNLEKSGHECFVPEIPYFASRVWSIEEMAELVWASLPAKLTNENSIVVGNSLGGSVALALSERFTKTFLVASYTKTSTQMIGRGMKTLKNELNKIFYDPSILNNEQLNRYEGIWRAVTSSRASWNILKQIKRSVEQFQHDSYYEKYARQISIVCGEHDKISPPENFEELKSRYPNMSLFRISKCAHAIPIERPHELAKILLDNGGS